MTHTHTQRTCVAGPIIILWGREKEQHGTPTCAPGCQPRSMSQTGSAPALTPTPLSKRPSFFDACGASARTILAVDVGMQNFACAMLTYEPRQGLPHGFQLHQWVLKKDLGETTLEASTRASEFLISMLEESASAGREIHAVAVEAQTPRHPRCLAMSVAIMCAIRIYNLCKSTSIATASVSASLKYSAFRSMFPESAHGGDSASAPKGTSSPSQMYRLRKKQSVDLACRFLSGAKHMKWLQLLRSQPKKDDMADALLVGLAYCAKTFKY